MNGVKTETQILGNLLTLTSFKGKKSYTETLFCFTCLGTSLLLKKIPKLPLKYYRSRQEVVSPSLVPGRGLFPWLSLELKREVTVTAGAHSGG